MELTPMRVNFNGVDLGGTLGNVVVSAKYSKAEIKSDQSGETVRDRRTTGVEITVTTEIAEIQLKDNWKVVFPHANLVTSGLNKMIYWTQSVGDSDLARSAILILHPLSKADADLSGDYKFFKACSIAESEITYGPGDQARLKIVWNILPDDSVNPERFMIHGDPTIGLVAASAAAPVYVGTGNGTLTGVSVFSGFTKTETITATAIHSALNDGIFQVSGSLSGPLGNATVGVGFSSPVIAFTINDGSTDFVIGDQFTIATTAANYV
jgi:hypothetical protein